MTDGADQARDASQVAGAAGGGTAPTSDNEPAIAPRPETGHHAVDRALASLDDLSDTPLDNHHDRLAEAHDALQQALDQPRNPSDGKPGPRAPGA